MRFFLENVQDTLKNRLWKALLDKIKSLMFKYRLRNFCMHLILQWDKIENAVTQNYDEKDIYPYDYSPSLYDILQGRNGIRQYQNEIFHLVSFLWQFVWCRQDNFQICKAKRRKYSCDGKGSRAMEKEHVPQVGILSAGGICRKIWSESMIWILTIFRIVANIIKRWIGSTNKINFV